MEYGGGFAAGSGENPPNWDFAPLNIRQVSIFFSVYIFFLVWNQINCRSLTPETHAFYRLFANPTFLVIFGIIAVGQILITSVPFLGAIFEVEPLGLIDWGVILVGTASVLVFAEAWRRWRLATMAK